MTSSEGDTFVFIQLPATGAIVVAGRYSLESTAGGRIGRFVYGNTYLRRPEAIALDPENLPLIELEFTTTNNDGMFGVLRDASPDYWGRLVIDRRGPAATNELEYLLATTDVRVGALSFGPDAVPGKVRYDGVLKLVQLSAAAAAADALEGELDGEEPLATELEDLLHLSSPMGGARPKTVVIDERGQLWMAKFPARGDRWNNAITESAFLALARLCGLRVPNTKVVRIGDLAVLLVQRFDQEPSSKGPIRRPFMSAYSLFDLDEKVLDRRRWSYLEFSHLVRKFSSRPAEDARELFSRAVFNALVSNLDDHPRNHAMLMLQGKWRLSPAYDLTPSRTRSLERRELAMACGITPGRERWANRQNLISGAGSFGIDKAEADNIIMKMMNTISSSWERLVTAEGGTAQDRANISHAFPTAYPGFEYAG
jgi:serine/threonine-protein kinase HipA